MADELADVCYTLEIAGKDEQWDEIEPLVSQLDVLLESVKAYMENYIRLA